MYVVSHPHVLWLGSKRASATYDDLMRSGRDFLLVEDDLLDAELTQLALSKSGALNRICHVRDGAEALEYLERSGKYADATHGNPGLIILDLKTPNLSGLDVLQWVRLHPSFKYTPVVMVTSSREGPDLMNSYRLGANGYVVKGMDRKEFEQSLASMAMFWGKANESPDLVETMAST